MKKIIFILVFVCSGILSGQNINDYKYALIPARFTVFKTDDFYRLNVLSKMYMEKYGFVAYLTSDEQSVDFKNSIDKLHVDLVENNSLFMTKIQVVLKDNNGKIIVTSPEGKSKNKDKQVAYNEALRQAFDTFTILINHKYNATKAPIVNASKDVLSSETMSNQIQTTTSSGTTELFAKPYQNGFQLLTNTTAIPNLVLTITKTSSPDYFIAEQNENKGIFIKKENIWYFEYYKEGKLITEKYTIVNF